MLLGFGCSYGEEIGWDVVLGHSLGVGAAVASELPKSPGCGGLDVVLGFVDEGVFEWRDGFGCDDGSGVLLVEGGDVTEAHDTWESSVSFGISDILDKGGSSSSCADQVGEVTALLGDFSDASGSIFSDNWILVFQESEHSWEDIVVDNLLGKFLGVFGNLGEARAYLSLQMTVLVRDQRSQEGNSSLVDDLLSQIGSVFTDLGEGRGSNLLQIDLRFLDTKNQKRNSSGVNNMRS